MRLRLRDSATDVTLPCAPSYNSFRGRLDHGMVIWDGCAWPFPLVLRTLTNMKWNDQRWVRVTAEDHLFLRLDAPDDTSVDAAHTERNAWRQSHAGGFCGAGGNARRDPEADDLRDPFPLTYESQKPSKQSNQLATHDNASFRQQDRESSRHLTGREQEKHQAGGPATARIIRSLVR
jgi:hypothetical protein